MKLSRRLEGDFTAGVRQRGQSYAWQHLVRLLKGSEVAVEAQVLGGDSYHVSLTWDDPFLSVSCQCPYFDSEGACKHIWATLLTAETQGYLAAVAAAPEVILDDSEFDEDSDDTPEELELPSPSAELRSHETPGWKKDVAGIVLGKAVAERLSDSWPAKREILYLVDVQSSVAGGNLVLTFETRDRKVDGRYSQATRLNMKRSQVPQLPTADREIMTVLAGGLEYHGWGDGGRFQQMPYSSLLSPSLAAIVMPMVVATGRCRLKNYKQTSEPKTLVWDEGAPWRFELELKPREATGWAVVGYLCRDEERLELRAASLITPGLVFIGERVARLADNTPQEWISYFRRTGFISAPEKDGEALLAELLRLPGLPPMAVAEELRYEEVTPQPRPLLKIRAAKAESAQGKVRAALLFDYAGTVIPAAEKSRGVYDSATRRFVRRDLPSEDAAETKLKELGLRSRGSYDPAEGPMWELAANKLPRAVRTLVEGGWQIEAEGKLFRRPGASRMEVSSGVDWFELRGEVEYGDTTAHLPELLEALRRGETVVRLGDGTYGVLPEEWLQRIGMVAGLGAAENGHIRFRANQVGLLDALLATRPEVTCDESFALARERLRAFEGIQAGPQPDGFIGQLRDYQREGLGWMEFLRHFSFGGCLADDMGVGKTAQVLALLETRRELRAQGQITHPSLVVVPRSLVFNWKEEAARFTPQLRVLDHTGAERNEEEFAAYDVVLTTYGTLRRDAPRLKDIYFDYVVLDEAQAVKNSATESAKAVRLLQGSHRLALSGTPVENHLGELFSLFDFLNPGMLNAASVFKVAGGGTLRIPGEESRVLLAQALRPFILRRTKEQVARELPPKTEQTIYCELKAPQRKLYNQLREHYRNTLLGRIAKEGLAKSKIQVLEALLRLRQAACHPGLIDPKRSDEASAKLDVLLAQLHEVVAEGHKALVFSQFTSLLKIVRKHLDDDGVVYEYLDGATRDRQAPVERFQNDESCRLFLISLKAGGLGLNLTAAGYVFLLDPWWNPAVEAQAVDRAHRIGQTQQVFAYRLIARDTVEEKVLELQKSKRDLANAIISADNSVIRNLQREDLELLLS